MMSEDFPFQRAFEGGRRSYGTSSSMLSARCQRLNQLRGLWSPQAPDGFPHWPLIERKVKRHPTDIHFVQGLMALRIEVVRCLPKWDDPHRRNGIRRNLRYVHELDPRVLCSLKIFPQPHDPAPNTLFLRHGEIFIPPVKRVKNSLLTDFLELPQKCPFRAVVLTFDQHVMTRLSGKIRIDENDLALTEEGVHRTVFHLHGEGTPPGKVCFK